MSKTDMASRIVELKAKQLPVMVWSDLLTEGKKLLTEDQKASLNGYFKQFMVAPTDDDGKELCPCCRKRMQSGVEGAIYQMAGLGVSLERGLAHGEAFCSGCGWPYRVYHFDIGGKDGEALITRVNAGLPYHPSRLEQKQGGEQQESCHD